MQNIALSIHFFTFTLKIYLFWHVLYQSTHNSKSVNCCHIAVIYIFIGCVFGELWTSRCLTRKTPRKLNFSLIPQNWLQNCLSSKSKMDSTSLCFYSNHMTKMEHNTNKRSNINELLNLNQHKPDWQVQSHHATSWSIIILTMTSWILPLDS